MVDLQTKYNLNHIYTIFTGSPLINIGDHESVGGEHFELFEKSLALTSDIEKLPVIRSINITELVDRLVRASMAASGVTFLKCTVYIFNTAIPLDNLLVDMNEEYFQLYQLLYTASTVVQYDGTANPLQIITDREAWPYKGGLLAAPKMTIIVTTESQTNVAAVALVSDALQQLISIEIDWIKITQAQFKDYILEQVYANPAQG